MRILRKRQERKLNEALDLLVTIDTILSISLDSEQRQEAIDRLPLVVDDMMSVLGPH